MSDTPAGETRDLVESAPGALDLVTRAARDGAADAREAAARTWAKSSHFASRLVYTTCYTFSYGVVFPAMLLARAVPSNNAAVRGLREGAQAARHKVDQLQSLPIETRIATPVPALSPA